MTFKLSVILPLIACGALAQLAPPIPQVPSNGPALTVLQQPLEVSYGGSVATGQASATPLQLSLREAIRRGLQYNLGVLSNRDISDTARAERRRTLSTLLPNLSAGAAQTSQQIDLAAFGFHVPGFPSISGPFGYQNVRGYFQQTVYDRTSLKNLKSATESRKAAALTAEDARNLVVQAVSNAYLGIISDAARVEAIQAELTLAQALFDRATDQKKAGTVAGIDVLRAEVELRTEQQRLLAQKNQVEKDKLVLARAIGLPAGQQFSLTDLLPFTPLATTLDDLLKQAYDHRADFRAAQANVRAAEYATASRAIGALLAFRGSFWRSRLRRYRVDAGELARNLQSAGRSAGPDLRGRTGPYGYRSGGSGAAEQEERPRRFAGAHRF